MPVLNINSPVLKKGSKYKMTKYDVYETVFTVIQESTEWGMDSESKVYGNYICGICDFVQKLLEEIEYKGGQKSSEDINKNTYSM